MRLCSFLPDSAAVRPAVNIRDKICDMGDVGHPAWDVCCTGRAFDTHGYVGCFDGNIYMARLCLADTTWYGEHDATE